MGHLRTIRPLSRDGGRLSELAPGTIAPSLDLPRLGGGEVALPGDGPLNLVVFEKSGCPTCRWALPFFESLHAGTRDGSLSVTLVASDDEPTTHAFVEDLGLTMPVGIESEPWPASVSYGLSAVPTFFLTDETGEILLSSAGFSRADLEEVARRVAERDGTDPVDPFPEGVRVPPFRPG